jgi:hypothetical protein
LAAIFCLFFIFLPKALPLHPDYMGVSGNTLPLKRKNRQGHATSVASNRRKHNQMAAMSRRY